MDEYSIDTGSNQEKLLIAHKIREKSIFNIKDIIILLKEVLNKLDSSNNKNIVNFAKYKHLLLFSAKYLELTKKEKKNLTIEMLFNLF